ncbi:MAG: hypothetical protein IJC43_04650 [Clostridia bacterium]|nr:hypothetical protein [Clostridia bacterium]
MTERDKKDGMGAKLIVPAVLLMFVAPQLAAFIILGLALTWSGKKKKEMRQNRGLSTLDGGSKKKPRRIPATTNPPATATATSPPRPTIRTPAITRTSRSPPATAPAAASPPTPPTASAPAAIRT